MRLWRATIHGGHPLFFCKTYGKPLDKNPNGFQALLLPFHPHKKVKQGVALPPASAVGMDAS
jgi:hypothetical protein